MSISEHGSDSEDWYAPNDSETEKEVPDPNSEEAAMYQDVDKLPEHLSKNHFQEGLIYLVTLGYEKNKTALGMIIEVKAKCFIFRVFYTKGRGRKTFHDGGKDKQYDFEDVWRLAPRRDLMLPQDAENIRIGQTINFDYGNGRTTIRVESCRSRSISGMIECGKERGSIKEFEKIEILDCFELFASSLLQKMNMHLSDLEWENGKDSRTKDYPTRTPALNPDFCCPEPIRYKRL